MTKKLILVAVAVAMVTLAAGTAMARWGGGPYGGWCGGPGAAAWGPTDKATQDLRTNLWNKHRALYDEMAKDQPDAAKVRALTQEINTLRGKLYTRMTEYRLKNPDARRYARGPGWRGGQGWHRGPGWGYGRGQGYGRGYGRGYGPGGDCW
jgi:Spy/CpxP family protein refolding chaperone